MSLSCLSSAERRARAILDTYGSQPANWPVAERQATLNCIARSSVLQIHQTQVAELDNRIHAEYAESLPQHREVLALQQRILAAVPVQTGTHSARIKPVWKRLGHWLCNPPFVAALASVAVLAIVMLWLRTPPSGTQQETNLYQAWSWYDITGQDLPAATASSALTMTDWVELDVNEDGS